MMTKLLVAAVCQFSWINPVVFYECLTFFTLHLSRMFSNRWRFGFFLVLNHRKHCQCKAVWRGAEVQWVMHYEAVMLRKNAVGRPLAFFLSLLFHFTSAFPVFLHLHSFASSAHAQTFWPHASNTHRIVYHYLSSERDVVLLLSYMYLMAGFTLQIHIIRFSKICCDFLPSFPSLVAAFCYLIPSFADEKVTKTHWLVFI